MFPLPRFFIGFILFSILSSIHSWHERWDFSKPLSNLDPPPELKCFPDGTSLQNDGQKDGCCVCNNIIYAVESALNNTENDYKIDVVFRMSEKKKRIWYSRSEARIIDVLDTICQDAPSNLLKGDEPSTSTRAIVKSMCEKFIHEFEDDIISIFWDNHLPAVDDICQRILKVCDSKERTKSDEL